MGKHSGVPEEESPPPTSSAPSARSERSGPPRQRLLVLGAGTLVTVIVWGVLVAKAISLGSDARRGESAAWIFVFVATVGATACMFVALILGNKALAVLRGAPLRRRASVGGKRAAR